jgi:uncharacterized protein
VPSEVRARVLVGCLLGLVCYLAIHLISVNVADRADADGASRPRTTVEGRGAFLLFVYLELLDATFSMDSVMGGFSVTVDIALITLGLAIGAGYIRALTVYVVRRGTLEQYRYLEHGAYYSIALLSVLLLWEVWRDVPDWITACVGAVVITAAYVTSVWAARRQGREQEAAEAGNEIANATVQAFTGTSVAQRLDAQSAAAPGGQEERGGAGGGDYDHRPPVAS